MRSLARLFGAVGTLADSVLALAVVLDAATARLRQQLSLGGETSPQTIEHQLGSVENVQAAANGTAKGRKARTGD